MSCEVTDLFPPSLAITPGPLYFSFLLVSDWSRDAFKLFPLPHLRPARSWPEVLMIGTR